MAEPADFAGLRRQAIAFAQEFSGEVWSDYNLHDPGVTLLEQVCFALTELGYRAGFPVADLLTGADGRIDFRRLALDPPAAVLASRPVTARDLALALGAAHPAVERVLVYPCQGAERGLHDLHVVPAADADSAVALAAVRHAFHANRNLCEDVRTLAPAVPVRCRLEARIETSRRQAPERVAALVYDRCARLMRDRGAAQPHRAATRADVFEDPALVWSHLADPDGGAAALDLFFAELTRLDEIEDVTSLAFRRLDDPERDAFAPLGRGEYRELVLPERPEEIGLVLASRDLEIPFRLAAMRVELSRLRADHVARLDAALDSRDWAPPPPGRRRRFDHVPLGHGLPPAYGAGPDAAAPRSGQIRGYLGLLDAPLADAAADLGRLPELFAADLAARESYAGGPPGADAAGAAFDPWRDRKGRVLDYLLALHGEAFSQNSLRQHDVYRGPAARRDAVLASRARLVREIAALNRARAGAPDIPAGERSATGGLGRKLALLLDFPDRGTGPLGAALPRSGLVLAPGLGPEGNWRLSRDSVAAPVDPFETLVPRIEVPEPPDPSGLIASTAFLSGRAIGADVLRRGVSPDAYLVAPEAAGAWRLLVDPGTGGDLLDVARFADRAAAVRHANALRAVLTGINRRSEGVHLVEDVLLRGGGSFEPLTLTAVFAGWSARTAAPAFRRLAEETLALLCPAHLVHRVLWLDHAEMQAFEALELDWRVAYRDAAGGEAVGRAPDLGRAGAALRRFLAAPEAS